MDSKYRKLKQVQHGHLEIKRLKKYLTLYGAGLFLWVGHLWQLLLEQLKYIDSTTHHWAWRWTIGLFEDQPQPKVYPIVYAIDTVGFVLFLLGLSYVIYWIYADTYCESYEKNTTISFRNQLLKAAAFNIITYAALRMIL